MRVDGLADVVQQRGEQKLFVVRQCVAGQVEHLQAVVQRIPFGMVLGILLHVFQRQQQRLEDLKAIELVLHLGQFLRPGRSPGYSSSSSCSSSAMLARSIGLPVIELLNTYVRLVRGVDRQLEREPVAHVNVREDALLAVLAEPACARRRRPAPRRRARR